MLGPSLHFNTSFKKNWKFVWALGVGAGELSGGLIGAIDNIVTQGKELANTFDKIKSIFQYLKVYQILRYFSYLLPTFFKNKKIYI